jgi:hypothetical protein
MNIYFIEKALDEIAGKVKNASLLNNCNLLENNFRENRRTLLKSYHFEVERHVSATLSLAYVRLTLTVPEGSHFHHASYAPNKSLVIREIRCEY